MAKFVASWHAGVGNEVGVGVGDSVGDSVGTGVGISVGALLRMCKRGVSESREAKLRRGGQGHAHADWDVLRNLADRTSVGDAVGTSVGTGVGDCGEASLDERSWYADP